MRVELILYGLIILIFPLISIAQQNRIDSLLTIIEKDKLDTNKVIHLNKLSNEFIYKGEFQKCLSYGKQALSLAESIGYKVGAAEALNILGTRDMYLGNYPEAIKMMLKGLKIQEEIRNKPGIARAHISLGALYYYQEDFQKASEQYLLSLKENQEIGDKNGIANSYIGIGVICTTQGMDSAALKNYCEALKIKEETGEDKKGIALANANIGEVYKRLGNYEESLKFNYIALKIRQENGLVGGVGVSSLYIGEVYLKLKELKRAEIYIKEALNIFLKISDKYWTQQCYGKLFVLDSIKGDYKEAFTHHKLFTVYKDSLNTEEVKKKALQAEMQYEFDKREITLIAEQEKQNAITEKEKQKQMVIIYSIIGILLMVIVFSFLLYKRFLFIRQQKQIIEERGKLIEEKQKEILDSIHYAKRIQTSLLPTEKYISRVLHNFETKRMLDKSEDSSRMAD